MDILVKITKKMQHNTVVPVTDRLGKDESISHQVQQGCGVVYVIEGVRCFQTAVHRMVHDGGRQCVETQEVGNFPL